jgi:site-specific DNA recombinase
MRRSSLGSSAIGVAEEAAEVIALPTALPRETSSAPAAQRRAVAYVRESTEEQGKGFSPEGQRQAIASYAREHGFELLDEYMDFESGRKVDKRDEFQRLIGDAGAHKFDAVLVFHTSRFARNTIEAKHYKKLLRSELGIEVISVTQPLGDTNDPAAFLAESVHEIFDEYYSVSLSFWTTMGLKEKARQGFLTGGLAWGYLKGEAGIAIPDPERAPLVLAIFEIYATGRYSHRDIAQWLNDRGQRTTRGNLFCADTVRDMLGNLTYCGYVTAQRSTSKEIRGKHEPLISEELFNRCADLRRQRTTTKNPGRPSPNYLLRSIVRCERCGGRMHGQTSGKKKEPRYYCANRSKRHTCNQPLAHADKIENQIAAFVAAFKPSTAMRDEILHRLASEEPGDEDTTRRQRQLKDRRKRLRDLYELGDLDKATYVSKRDAIDTELDTLAPGPSPDLDGARAILEDFATFWKTEPNPEPRRELLAQLFERVWIDGQRIVAVKPTAAFAGLFAPQSTTPPQVGRRGCRKYGSDGTRSRALRTGGSRSGTETAQVLNREAGMPRGCVGRDPRALRQRSG